ncbi:MAG: lysophospholipid acyltransferase family protein [Bacteroidales bacterium]|nr:lysophospholipid acyltransferase family protein [Bacteroidales bacterium]
MAKLLFRIYLFPLWLITLIPLNVLYLLSDLFYFLIYFVVRYRKKVVFNNLSRSFPSKTSEEIAQLSKKFYRHLCDYFIESIYALNISEKEINKRFRYTNIELIDQLYSKGKSIVMVTAHYNNFEWYSGIPLHTQYKALAVYHPLSNSFFDKLFIKIRQKFGVQVVPMKKTLRTIMDYNNKNIPVISLFIADQRPDGSSLNYWTTFLNQDTPVITGPERIAVKLNQAVVYFEIVKKSRGHYEIIFHLITENPAETKPGEITEKYIHKIEDIIISKPEYWLWSHKRWKYKKQNLT